MLSSGVAILKVAEPTYSLGDIRLAARQSGLQEIDFNVESRLISFSSNRSGELVEYPRINVYYSTRTVGTCIDHPQRGKTQLFRRNVDLELLRRLMRAPRLHTGRGYYIRQERTSTRANAMYASRVFQRTLNEETEADLEIERLKEHAAKIAELLDEANAVKEACQKRRENEALQKAEELQRAKESRKAQQEDKGQELALERYRRGKNCTYILPRQHHNHVNECFDPSVVSVATNGDAIIFLYENGNWAWTSGLTQQLYNKLHGRSLKLPSPVYVSIGSKDRYYIRFADGQSQWWGGGLAKTLKDTDKQVATVAFGEEWDSYFVVFADGGWAYNNVPDGLDDLIERRQRRGDLVCVSLGPAGEWFLRARNGRTWWGGLQTKSRAYVERINQHKDSLTFLDFGGGSTMFLRYNK